MEETTIRKIEIFETIVIEETEDESRAPLSTTFPVSLAINGGLYSVSIPAASMIVFGEDGKCGGASTVDGPASCYFVLRLKYIPSW